MTAKLSVVKLFSDSDTSTSTGSSSDGRLTLKCESNVIRDQFYSRLDETVLYGIDRIFTLFQSKPKDKCEELKELLEDSSSCTVNSSSSNECLKEACRKIKCDQVKFLDGYECKVATKEKASQMNCHDPCDSKLEEKLCKELAKAAKRKKCERDCERMMKCVCGPDCDCKCRCKKLCKRTLSTSPKHKNRLSLKMKDCDGNRDRLLKRNMRENLEFTREMPTDSQSQGNITRLSYEKIDRKSKLCDDDRNVKKTLKIKKISSGFPCIKNNKSTIWSATDIKKCCDPPQEARRTSCPQNGEKKLQELCCKFPKPKLLKTEWAVTQVNYFDDKSRTFEVTKSGKHCYDFFSCPKPTCIIFAVLPDGSTVSYKNCPKITTRTECSTKTKSIKCRR